MGWLVECIGKSQEKFGKKGRKTAHGDPMKMVEGKTCCREKSPGQKVKGNDQPALEI